MKRLEAACLAVFRALVLRRIRRVWRDGLHDGIDGGIDGGMRGGTDAGFRAVWARVSGNLALKWLHRRLGGMIQYGFYDFAYAQIVDLVHANYGAHIAAPVAWDNPDLLTQIERAPTASLIVSRHYGFAYTLAALAHADREFATVAGFPDQLEEHYRRSGIRTMPKTEIIETGNKCLVRLLGAARKGKIITCQPDAINGATGALEFINLYFFAFAAKARVPMYFAKHAMTASGELQGVIAGPIDSGDARDAANRFIAFSRPEASFRIHPVHGEAATGK